MADTKGRAEAARAGSRAAQRGDWLAISVALPSKGFTRVDPGLAFRIFRENLLERTKSIVASPFSVISQTKSKKNCKKKEFSSLPTDSSFFIPYSAKGCGVCFLSRVIWRGSMRESREIHRGFL